MPLLGLSAVPASEVVLATRALLGEEATINGAGRARAAPTLHPVSFFRGMDDPDSLRWEPITRAAAAHEEERRSTRSGRLGTGTLACNRCDAPVALAGTAALTDILSCPFCSHRAPLRDFLSLAAPSRPARVEVRVLAPPIARVPPRGTARTPYSGRSSATDG